MNLQLVGSILAAFCCLVVLGKLLQFLRRNTFVLADESELNVVDRESFADYYRPMLNLLDRRELETARLLNHLRPSDYSQFRAHRIRAFQLYLNELATDFRRIEFKLRYLLLAAPAQQVALVEQLNQSKLHFQFHLAKLRLYLVAFRFGWVTLDASPLISALEQFDAVLHLRPARR